MCHRSAANVPDALLTPVFNKHGGTVIKRTGDGYLVEFTGALQAVQCAVEAQKVVVARNAVVAPADRLHVRIGLHVADVVHKERDILGDGVNLAARVEPLADEDGICLTEEVARQISGKIDEAVERVGRRRLKNIRERVTVYRVCLPWTPGRRSWPLRRAATAGLVSLALVVGFLAGRLWKPPGGGMRHDRQVNGVTFSPDGDRLVSVGDDKTLRVWDVSRQKEIVKVAGTHAVLAVAFGPDGRVIASGGMDHNVHLWDAATGHELLREPLVGHLRPVNTVAFSPNGGSLASGGEDGRIILWDIVTGAALQTFTVSAAVMSVAFSVDGRTLVSAGNNDTITIWDLVTGRQVKTLPGHGDEVTGVVFIPGSRRLASSSYDGTVRVWDPASGAAVWTRSEHVRTVWAVAVSPDGTMLATAGSDGTVRVWGVATGMTGQPIRTGGGEVYAVAWSKTGMLAWGNQDGSVTVRKAPTGP
jgi:WD40 repeat protein